MKTFGVLGSLLVAALVVGGLAGCGGGSAATTGGGGSGTGGGTGGGTVAPAKNGTALVTVDAVSNTATVKPLDPASRSIFSGSAVTISSVKVNEDPGEVTTRQIKLYYTNNTGGTLSNLRFAITNVVPVSAPVTDVRANTNVTSVAGNGSTGTISGSSLSSPLGAPYGTWVDTDGSVYVTSSSNACIRKIANGQISTVYVASGQLPYGLTGDANYLYFTSYTTHVVFRVRKDGSGALAVAGSAGVAGDVDGAAGSSKLSSPTGLTIDSGGNLYVADFGNNKVKKITSPGGTPNCSAFTTGVSAPYSLADLSLDGSEYLALGTYSSLGKVYLINALAGSATPITGTSSTAAASGPANTVGLNIVKGLATSGGRIFVAESGRQDLKVIYRANGSVATDAGAWTVASFAGPLATASGYTDGSGTAALFNNPTGLAFGSDGALLVADTANNKLRHIVFSNSNILDGSGNSSAAGTVAVSRPDTYLTAADGGSYPAFISTGPLYSGGLTSLQPIAFNLSSGVTQFQFVVTVDGTPSYQPVLDAVNHAVGAGSPNDFMRTLTRPWTGITVNTGLLSDVTTAQTIIPCFAADGSAFLAIGPQIFRVDTAGNVTAILGSAAQGLVDGNGLSSRFVNPRALACTPDGNTLYTADAFAVRRATGVGGSPLDWNVTTIAGGNAGGTGRGQGNISSFGALYGIAISPNGHRIYVGDATYQQIVAISPDLGSDLAQPQSWNTLNLAGTTSGYLDGPGNQAKFGFVAGIAVSGTGDIYVADTTNGRIRKVTAAGNTTTLTGAGGFGYVDGLPGVAQLDPSNIAVDSSGYVYFGDLNAHAIRRVSPSGEVLTIASSTVQSSDGNCATASLGNPYTLAISPSGTLWFNDSASLRSIERVIGR